ncbi:MAG: hypothetical protein CL764_00555 [Chloroflexi bacterium]|nr:hypothetical protein [Chloroflexota bacterium]
MVGFKDNQLNKTILLLIIITIIFLSKASLLIAEGSSNFEYDSQNINLNIEIKPEVLTTSEEIRLKITPVIKNNLASLKSVRIDILACFNSCNVESKIQKIKSLALNSPQNPDNYFSLFKIEDEGDWEIVIKISNNNFSDNFSIPVTVNKKPNNSNYYSTSITFLFIFLVLVIFSIFIGLKSKKNIKLTRLNS